MITSSTKPEGSVLIDGVTVENSLRVFYELRGKNKHDMDWHNLAWSDTSWLERGNLTLVSFANFIESLVLHDKLFLDGNTYQSWKISGNLDKIDKRFSNVIGYLMSKPEQRIQAYNYTKHALTLTNLDEVCEAVYAKYPEDTTNLELGMTSGFWHDEDHVTIGGFEQYPSLVNEVMQKYPKSRRPNGSSIGLVDCAVRAWYYAGLANIWDIMYVPNDFRALFIDPLGIALASAQATLAELENTHDELVKRNLNFLRERIDNNKLRLPMIFTNLLIKAKNPSELLEQAFEERESDEARRFREKCRQIDRVRTQDAIELDRLTSELKDEIENIGRRIHQGRLDRILDSISIGPSFPLGFGVSIGLGGFRAIFGRTKKHITFIRNVFRGTTSPRDIDVVYLRKSRG